MKDKMEASDVHAVIKTEQEKERKRRMSAPYSSDNAITDLQIHDRRRRLSDLHEEIFKLFAVNIVSFQFIVRCSKLH